MSTLNGQSLIGFSTGRGSVVAGHGINATTGEPLEPPYLAAAPEEVARACQLAAAAFPAYAATAPEVRAAFLRGIAENIEAIGEPLVTRMAAESALPVPRIVGERGRTCGQLRLFAALIEAGWWADPRIEHAIADRAPLPKPDMRSTVVPLGPVAIFCPANFPLAFSVAGGDTASALAAGCPVVVHAHMGHPGTAELVGQAVVAAAKAAGLPEGVFSLIYGQGIEAGQALVTHPEIRGIGFTGSRRGGRAIMDAAAARPVPVPVYAEMSSVNPVFLLPGALAASGAALATAAHGSVTGTVGQFCTKPGVLFVPTGELGESFASALAAAIAGTTAGPMLNASIAANYAATRAALAGRSVVVAVGAGDQALLSRVSGAEFLASPALQEEVFGPASLLVFCESEAERLACAQALEGQLTASIHAAPSDHAAAEALGAVLVHKAGRLIFNGWPTGLEVCHATVHGGPYPATSDGRTTSVGSMAINRWVRAVCYQGWPEALLPAGLRDSGPAGLRRLVDGVHA